MIDLKAKFGDRYRITLDESAEIPGQTNADRAWLQQIHGKSGHVFIQGAETLGSNVRTFNDGSNRLGRLLAIPGARLLQRGDREASVAFQPEYLEQVAEILNLRKRVRVSEERKAELRARVATFNAARSLGSPQ